MSLAGRGAVLCLGMLSVFAPVRRARACGVEFPPMLLDNRGAAFEVLPAGTFADEMTRLVSRPEEAFVVVEGGEEPQGARTGGGARGSEDPLGLGVAILGEKGRVLLREGEDRQTPRRQDDSSETPRPAHAF